ncbi:hypothetical protein ZIOFF_055236 [Zingiber officinale]|uniref:AB hydrolase-1 domain-containing protein n=1 Tax=Zingiber officinale TaxID=94328 RepID=A0A8J5FFG8_ZINOF|nr:hypothetical protein ZIOFF_055236 [Zingiber officinale]
MPVLTTISSVGPLLRLLPAPSARSRSLRFRCRASSDSDQEYLVDAPESVGDGFSFSGGLSFSKFKTWLLVYVDNTVIVTGKYSDGPNRADEWLALGKTVKAHPVYGGKGKAKDPIFGLTLGAGSQSSADVFRWFCVEAGSSLNSPIILVHGFPSQAYSYRKVITMLSENYRAIAFDWLGFGFSDKPQPRYGFDYTLDEYVLAFESLVNVLVPGKVSLVVQGYFCPVVLKYASCHQEKLSELILVNPPLMEKHAKLPSSLALFSNFLLGEIFSQDPLRASDKALTSCGPYMMKEEDAMVYRRPYLTSGSSGFALNAISKAMKRDLKDYVKAMRTTLSSETWEISTTICWGMRDRWLSYDGVEEFCKASNHKLVQLPMAGHHVQEDTGRELGRIISQILSKNK